MKKKFRKMYSLLKKLHKKHKGSYFGEITGEKEIKKYKHSKLTSNK